MAALAARNVKARLANNPATVVQTVGALATLLSGDNIADGEKTSAGDLAMARGALFSRSGGGSVSSASPASRGRLARAAASGLLGPERAACSEPAIVASRCSLLVSEAGAGASADGAGAFTSSAIFRIKTPNLLLRRH